MVPKYFGLPRALGIPYRIHSNDVIDCSTVPPYLHGVAVPQGGDSLEGIYSHGILHRTHHGLLLTLLPIDNRGAHTLMMGRHCGDMWEDEDYCGTVWLGGGPQISSPLI